MMKILLLNAHLHEAPVLNTLRNLGVAVLVCSDLRECELVFRLHGTSVSLFVGHDDDGVKMNEVLKTHARFSKTPVILTTSKWTDQQCIEHQDSPMGANAYLRLPVDDRDFIHVIDAILGTELSHGKGFLPSDDLPMAAVSEDATRLSVAPAGGIQIEDGATVYNQASSTKDEADAGIMISLDAPELDVNLEFAPSAKKETTKEFKIDADRSESASEILAVPIEGTSLDAKPADIPVDAFASNFIDMPPLTESEEAATRLVMAPASAEATRVAAPVMEDDLATRVASVFAEDAATRVAMPIQDEAPTRAAFSINDEAATQVAMPVRGRETTEEIDPEALSTMPYLGKAPYANPLGYREPMDDAVVPGGAAQAPDVETLKKYLYLREQDVTALSAQLRQAREQVTQLENQLRHEKAISTEFAHLAQEQDRRIGGFEKEKSVALESAQKELDEVRFEMKRRNEKIRVMELQVKEATDATERLKERVRNDIRKIRTREKELENRLEIMKKDSEALLTTREQKIIDLKRKLDLIEFNTDLLQDQLEKEKRTSAGLREKLAKAAQIVRVAGGLLSPEEEALLA